MFFPPPVRILFEIFWLIGENVYIIFAFSALIIDLNNTNVTNL